VCAVKQDDELHIHNIAVSAPRRGGGIGRLLLERVEAWGSKRNALCALLDVRASNCGAIAFYKALQYKVIGQRKDYYHDPREDALVLMKILAGGLAEHE
jgi:ribosomal-protein-alanine N-acetyltransferase